MRAVGARAPSQPRSSLWQHTWSDKAAQLRAAPPHVIDGYHFLTADQYEALAVDFLRHARLEPGHRVLEVGCGAGALLDVIRSDSPGTRRTGVDYAAQMVDFARSRCPGDEIVLDDARGLRALADHRFDVTVTFAMLCYLDDQAQAVHALDAMCRVTRPGGRVAVGDVSDTEHRGASESFLARAWAPIAIPEYLYLTRDFFRQYAASRGYRCRVHEISHAVARFYEPAPFRFAITLEL